MTPPIMGPKEGPMNGADEMRTIGVWISLRENTSPIIPPATERKVPPAKPLKNRATTSVSMFLPTADGMVQIVNIDHETR